MKTSLSILSAFVLGFMGQAYALPEGISTAETDFGTVLTDADGMTLYTFTQDEVGKSNCQDSCLKKWPLAEVPEGGTEGEGFTILERADGARQWMYQQKPLYTWVMDLAPGQTTGHQVGGVWFAAQPEIEE